MGLAATRHGRREPPGVWSRRVDGAGL